MYSATRKGEVQKPTHENDESIVAEPFRSFTNSKVVVIEETGSMLHEDEQQDPSALNHDVAAHPNKVLRTSLLVQFPWLILQGDLYFCQHCSINTKL